MMKISESANWIIQALLFGGVLLSGGSFLGIILCLAGVGYNGYKAWESFQDKNNS